jgi:hypothetical protein
MFLKQIPQDTSLGMVKIEGLESKLQFYIPLKDIPIYIQNKKLVLLRDSENQSYYMSLNNKGNFNLFEPAKSILQKAYKYLEPERQCPESKDISPYFLGHFCRRIYNFDTQEVEIIRLDWPCP